MAIKKDPTRSVRKHVNELKVNEKTVRTVIKEDLRPDVNPLDYAIRAVLEYKANVTSHQNIYLLKIAIDEEWNKISEEFIFKPCVLITINENMVAIISKFTVLVFIFLFCLFF